MSFRYLLSFLGCALIAFGATRRDWLISIAWLGGNFLTLGVAHAFGFHRVLGKRSDGTIAPWQRFVFLPPLAYTSAVWHLARLLSREPAHNVVTDDLVVGRRLLPSELDRGQMGGEFDNYVDLTAEFAEPAAIRRTSAYISFPVLDGAAPLPEALRAAVGSLRPGRTFVHCAQGHGRTGLFALALLLTRGSVGSVEEGLRVLAAARPGIRLNAQQVNCIRDFAMGSSP
jgi:hypothetical protein